MKFLHAADIHLDSPLAGLRARADLPERMIRHSTRRAFSALIDLAIAEDVAFMVIAGDLYDGDWKDFSTGLFFAAEMQRLRRPCFLLRGNHDARSLITRNLPLPPNVREFSSRTCETITLDDLGVALHGHSFPNRAVPEDLSADYPAPLSGTLNIGVLHTSAEDAGEHETYAPCSVASLRLKGYDYWALGHIHMRRVLSERPWIVFPGNTQGRHPKETGAKGGTLVTIEDRTIVSVEHRTVDVLRWVGPVIDVTGTDVLALEKRIREAVQASCAGADGRPLLARITFTGATEHDRLTNDAEQLAAECVNAAIAIGETLHVESIRVRTKAAPRPHDELLAPLRSAFLTGIDDPANVAALLADFARLRQKLPVAARAGLDVPEDADGLRNLAEEAWSIAADALTGADPG